MNRAALSAESAKRTPPFTFGWLATIPTGRPPRRAKPTMISRAKRQIGRAHVWNSSHSQISYAVFGLKKKESQLTSRLLVDVGGRYENYSDFGSTVNGKLAGRDELGGNLALRRVVSTGFRTPSLQQV